MQQIDSIGTHILSLCVSLCLSICIRCWFFLHIIIGCVCVSFFSFTFSISIGTVFFSISFGLLSICTSRLSAVSFFCVSCVFFQFRNGQTTRQNFTRIVSLRANANGKNRLTYYKNNNNNNVQRQHTKRLNEKKNTQRNTHNNNENGTNPEENIE